MFWYYFFVLQIVSYLLGLDKPKLDVNGKDDHNLTPLYHASCNRDVKMMELFLKAGASPNTYDSNGKGIWSLKKVRCCPTVCLKIIFRDVNEYNFANRPYILKIPFDLCSDMNSWQSNFSDLFDLLMTFTSMFDLEACIDTFLVWVAPHR